MYPRLQQQKAVPLFISAGRIKTRAAHFLEFSMRTAMHGKSRVLSATSVCHNQQTISQT